LGLKIARGAGWVHLGWVADPEQERYLIKTRNEEGKWAEIDRVVYGSWLSSEKHKEILVED